MKAIIVLSFAFIVLLLTGLVPYSMAAPATEGTNLPTYMITTRDIIAYVGVLGPGYGNYSFLDISQLSQQCPEEVAVFVHGWGNNETLAKERLDRVKLSLEKNNYTYPLVGLSWKSDTEWQAAKSIAKWNGPRLATFIWDLVDNCKKQNDNVKIRMIAHSLGARVILSALDSLHKNATWNNSNFNITSVHLLGGAVDNEEVSKNPQDILDDLTNWGTLKADYGSAIEGEVDKFYNLYNPEDNVFEPNPEFPFSPVQIYPSFEGDLALGYNGSQTLSNITLPRNYNQTNVQHEVNSGHDADAIEGEDLGLCLSSSFPFFCKVKNEGWDYGLCNFLNFTCPEPPNVGDNHAGYIGFRNLTNTSLLEYDGAMNMVVDDWRRK